jgi:hypothetical protein
MSTYPVLHPYPLNIHSPDCMAWHEDGTRCTSERAHSGDHMARDRNLEWMRWPRRRRIAPKRRT